MKEKWPYIALALIFLSSCYQGMTLIKGMILTVIIIRILWEKNQLLWIVTMALMMGLIVHLIFLDNCRKQQLALVGQEQQAIIQMDVNNLRINGDLLTGYATLETKEQRCKTMIYYKISSKKEKEWISHLQQDVKIVAKVSFEKIEGCRNLKNFDYSNYLKSRKIFISTKINQIEEIEVITGLKSKAHYWRYQLVDKVRQDNNGAITEYALALIFGEKQQLSQNDLAMFKELGIMHLLAISGLHIIILVNLLEGIMWRSGLTREASQWGLFVILVGYGYLIRWNISGTRAIGIVLLQIICLKLWQEDLSTMNALSVMAIVNCIVNPYIINSSAFQLSYGMCFFVILVGRLEVRFINDKEASDGYDDSLVKRLVHMGILCLLAIPLIARYFYSYHLLSALIGSIVTFILAKWLIPCLVGYVFLVIADSQAMLAVVVGVFNGSISLLLSFLEVVSQWKIFKVTLGAGNEVLWVCYYCAVLLLCLLAERPINSKQIMMMAITSVSIIMMLALVPYQFERKVIYLDIGQGDSSLIVDRGYNNVVLIDTGGQLTLPKEPWQIRKGASHAEKTVIPALQALGISRIKTLIITHADTDHMGNLKELSQVFPIDRVVMSQGMEKNPKMKQMMEKCPRLTWQLIKAPTTYQQGGIMMHILSPTNESTGDNHDSLVVDVKFCDVDWLFLGDIDQEKEIELLKTYPQIHTTILKLAHHGSHTSSHQQFLKEVNSSYAIISCGKYNHYHHPSKEVLKRLEEMHLAYARTDKEGAIEIIPKKDRIIVRKVLTNERLIIIPK